MPSEIHNQTLVKKYNVDELSVSQKWTIDNEEKNLVIKLTKIFISLNGASGSNLRNIPASIAGFFSHYADIKFYQRLKIFKGRLDSYQRYADITPRLFNNLKDDFSEIKKYWDHIVSERRGTIPDDITFEKAIEHFQELDNVTINNYKSYKGYSWIQWYEFLKTNFESINKRCKDKGESYKQNNKEWIVSSLSIFSWYNFLTNGCTRYSKTVEEYHNFSNSAILPKKSIVSSRLDDINTAIKSMKDLEDMIVLEQTIISEPKNCQMTQEVIQNTLVFKSECDRLLLTIRDSIGFISSVQTIDT